MSRSIEFGVAHIARVRSSLCPGLVVACLLAACSEPREAKPAALGTGGAKTELAAAYGKLPLAFQENLGQWDPRVRFVARGRGVDVFLTDAAWILSLAGDPPEKLRSRRARRMHEGPPPARGEGEAVIRMRTVGAATTTRPVGLEPLPGTANYFIGNDPSRWRTNVPTYASVKVPDVYPGIDLVFHGVQRQLEYDFVLAPGADPGSIRIAFDGVDHLRVNEDGDLVLTVGAREVVQRRPVAYEEEDGGSRRQLAVSGRREVESAYVVVGDGEVGFRVKGRDPARRLVIDPVLAYSTYLGGSWFNEDINGIAVDAWGSAYLTGYTTSIDFPTANPLQPAHGGGTYDGFVAKLSADGTALIYSTYLGGSAEDEGSAIAVDGWGNAYVTGDTVSTDFPTAHAFQPAHGGAVDAFVVKLNPSGSALVYSTYLGGSGEDLGSGIALDPGGNAYVTGSTASDDFPTAKPFQRAYQGGVDAFVAKLGDGGLVYSTYLGGSGFDAASAIAVDSAGRASVTGSTSSDDFPTRNALQPTRGGALFEDAFVARFSAGGRALLYSTYLGGSGLDEATAIAVDPGGDAYVTGNTWSLDFPTANPLQPVSGGGGGDAFVARLGHDGRRLVWSTYLGGSAEDRSFGVAVGPQGDVYLTGFTYSTDFPSVDPLQPAGGGGDAYVVRLDSSGTAFLYSTLLGGSSFDTGNAIAVDACGDAYVAGFTYSTDFPTANPFQPSGAFDGFVAKLSSSH